MPPAEQDLASLAPADVDRVIHEPARLTLMALLYVIQAADFTFLMAQTGLSWGNLSSHMSKLEAAGYIEVAKDFVERRPRTMLKLTAAGQEAFRSYRHMIKGVLDPLPE